MIQRVFVEKKDSHPARETLSDIRNLLKIGAKSVRVFIRYDVEGLTDEEFEKALTSVFSEPPVDVVYREKLELPPEYDVFAISYLTGQYDQRADSAAQCVQLLTMKGRPEIKCATVYAVEGTTKEEISRIKAHLINPVESEEVSLEKPETLIREEIRAGDVPVMEGFLTMSEDGVKRMHEEMGLAMNLSDLLFVRDYFSREGRDPTETEIRVIDTYWSDHCRHTTFNAEIKNIEIHSDNPGIEAALSEYKALFSELYAGRDDKYVSLMDVATIASKKIKKDGGIPNLDESEEINACSIKLAATLDGKEVPYTVTFKNETHNHPTEIEPFGGAATCLGGAIRDPLAGRTYVIQGMRVTGAADPTVPLGETMKGKLPQRVLTRTAARGFSSYGNQIGLATGQVTELYHDGFRAKRLETGFVVGGAPSDMIRRSRPEEGDVIILLGGETGRDGCGGATGSSKAHDIKSVQTCGAEVQKGNALTERKLQRLILNKKATNMIKRCNDFGAGGVAVAIGELAPGLDIELDRVPKKYEGLTGTELAISESQERMAVVVASSDADEFIRLSAEENLSATPVARVTDTGRLKMFFRGEPIVDISREFLDTNGVKTETDAEINDFVTHYFDYKAPAGSLSAYLFDRLSSLNVCSEKGLSEMFDSTIGAKSVYMPFGGKFQLTPAPYMAAKLVGGETDDCTVSAFGYEPCLMSSSPFTGAIYSVVASVAKVVAAGADYRDVRLSMQEFFLRLRDDKKRWGVPLSALLGAMHAQLGLGVASIGGKDSMSGSFEDIDVPPTLISFALAPAKASKLITNVLSGSGKKLYLLPMRKDTARCPDFSYLKTLYTKVHEGIEKGVIDFCQVVESGGAAVAVVKSCFGNMTGFKFFCDEGCLVRELYGDLIVGCEDENFLSGLDFVLLGETVLGSSIEFRGEKIPLSELLESFMGKLSGVFPSKADEKEKKIPFKTYLSDFPKKASSVKVARPRVFIPAFPGTNCEFDTARAFEKAGAETEILVIRNRSQSDITESVDAVVKAVGRANMIAFPGGFSGGDEPDGSGKFITATFKNPAIAEEVMKLLNVRDGLILGICNGFQALIKLGLLPYGKILPQTEKSPTLTYNTISRHVSTLVDVRVASTLSPWLSFCGVGEVYTVPVSHGEGKIVAGALDMERLYAKNQIATQYVGPDGVPTMESPYNPNGSAWAVEGLTSPDGRVLGKMGHSERIGENLYKNCAGNFDMRIFESGVKYFS
ncbi:MAG: phosphoribosylformylglycinamidine synthase [Clostridia bacterium]|nr:phosphoribosylformylglycinamidine synthase [Clostridia bacterium]